MANKYRYHLEARNYRGEWVAITGDGDGLAYNLGRIAERRASPGPRLAMRCVRSDGRVMEEAPELSEASIGMVAGFPTLERALERGGLNGDAMDKVRRLVDRLTDGS